MKHVVLSLLFALSSVLTALSADTKSSSTGPELLRLESSVDAMGSTYVMALYGTDQARLRVAAEEAAEEVRRLDHLLSNYIPSSEWSEVNRDAAKGPVRISPELFDL